MIEDILIAVASVIVLLIGVYLLATIVEAFPDLVQMWKDRREAKKEERDD